MNDTSTRIDSPAECSPLTPACVKALSDKIEEKRKLAACEIEKMTAEFGMLNNLTMVNRLIIVLGKKFCLSLNPNTRKGGLLGLAAAMVGYKNGAETEPPPEVVEEVVGPILTCFLDSDPKVRYYACESLYNVTKVAKANILPHFEAIFDNLIKIVADPDIGVRSGAELLDRLLKDIMVEQHDEIYSILPKFENYIYTKNPFARTFIISWIRLLDSKIDMIPYLPKILDGIFNCLGDSADEIRALTLNLLAEFLNKIVSKLIDRKSSQSPEPIMADLEPIFEVLIKELSKQTHPIVKLTILDWLKKLKNAEPRMVLTTWQDYKLFSIILETLSDPSDAVVKSALRVIADLFCFESSDANVNRFVQALYKTFHEKESVFEDRGTFIILNLCSMIKPEAIYRSFAEILKDEKNDLKFAYNLVQKLNQILLQTQPLSALRSRLSNENDPEVAALFQILYHAWCHSSIAVLTLCLLTNNYRQASELVAKLSQTDINLDVLTQIDWVVQLIESPVFAALRMRLLDPNNNQYLLQTLFGLLMILPQSEAYRRLGNRLDQVYKYMCIQPQSKVVSNPSISRLNPAGRADKLTH